MRCSLVFVCLVAVAVASTTEKPLVRCPRMLCAKECAVGYKTDDSGCPVCDCLQNPCELTECAFGTTCRPQTCNHHPCTWIEASCEAMPGRPCPEVMCANYCHHGYETSSEGCTICKCKHESCEELNCAEGTQCDHKADGSAYCKVRPLCHEQRDMWENPDMADMMKRMMGSGHMMGHMMGNPFMGRGPNMQMMPMHPMMMHMQGPLMCDEDTGDFMPRQCHNDGSFCCCVDDRGVEIDGTRTSDVNGLVCAHNRTSSLNMQMMMNHNMDDLEEHLDELRTAMEKQLSDWMQMDQRWINVDSIDPSETTMVIRVVVIQDGESDLPSIANFLQRQMQQGDLQMAFNDQFLSPDPDSVQIEHKFEILPPEIPDERGPEEEYPEPPPITSCIDLRNFRDHRMLFILGTLGIIFVITVMVGLLLAAMRKRRLALVQYQHRRFENMDTMRRNIMTANEMDLQQEEKKIPFDEPAPPYEEKVSIA